MQPAVTPKLYIYLCSKYTYFAFIRKNTLNDLTQGFPKSWLFKEREREVFWVFFNDLKLIIYCGFSNTSWTWKFTLQRLVLLIELLPLKGK